MLPSLALALLCLLRAGAEVPVQPDFNTEKFAGTWHIAAAVSNCSVFLKMKDGMKSSIVTISFTPEGNLAVKLVWPLLDKCPRFELLLQRSGQAGHYVGEEGPARDADGLQPLRHRSRAPAERAEAHGRAAALQEQNVSPQLLKKFKELIPSTGLSQDMLAILPQANQCNKAIR